MIQKVKIIGGGLAGCELALVLTRAGVDVQLYEMRPHVQTDVHQTGDLAELVCSNSLKSKDADTASGLLKEELKRLKSPLLQIAEGCAVPAGSALAVDRSLFSQTVTQRILAQGIGVFREEYCHLEQEDFDHTLVIIASGPLTSERLLANIKTFLNTEELFFFDAVAPIIESESIDYSKVFIADRYAEEQADSTDTLPKDVENTAQGEGAYINIPLNREQYAEFHAAVIQAETISVPDFERKYLFDRCQPFEEIAKSGYDALRFGPMKPVGLRDPKTAQEPYAVVQLRQENAAKNLYNLVGFQTRLTWSEQKRVLQKIPALENCSIVRYGVMHKNIYLNTAALLHPCLQSMRQKGLFFAGQITGMEGYMESVACGHFVSINVLRRLQNKPPIRFPRETMLGSLVYYITTTRPLRPMYANFGILPDLKAKKSKIRQLKSERALLTLENFLREAAI